MIFFTLLLIGCSGVNVSFIIQQKQYEQLDLWYLVVPLILKNFNKKVISLILICFRHLGRK